MKILLTARTGQVGYELERALQGVGEIIAVDRTQLDLADLRKVRDVIRAVRPTLIINAAAYTDVDRAEREPQLAMRINAEAPAVMAEEAKRLGAAMIHYSSDYVFDGAKRGGYLEEDLARPLNAYGTSKLAGEQGVQAAGAPYLILRTSWIYGQRGRNFLTTIQRLAQQREELRVVNDQDGTPTWSHTIATATADIVRRATSGKDALEWLQSHAGLYHLAAQGSTTWYGFAQAIVDRLSIAKKPLVIPIDSHQYQSTAVRPQNSVLHCGRWIAAFGELPKWDDALRLCMLEQRAS